MTSLQDKLLTAYQAWKVGIHISVDEARKLSPPLLISVPTKYEEAERRIFFLGQETYGWDWTSDYRKKYPRYDKEFPYKDLKSFAGFLDNDDAVEALCWGYREFDFAARQPENRRGSFWRAFREVQGWNGVSLVWGNLSRCDFQSGSIRRAPLDLKAKFAELQTELLADEIRILKPDACLFFSGPNYDWLLSAVLPGVVYAAVDDLPVRRFARLVHPTLPAKSFRTYHPRYLSQGRLWSYIEKLQRLVTDRSAL